MKTWNICGEDNNYKDLQNRTKDGLEQYNRTMIDKFPAPHPSLFQFITVLEEEARYQV